MYRVIFVTLMINISLIFPSGSAERLAYVTKENCQRLLAHIPADDVAYKAGVDVRGKAVAPADLAPSSDFASNLGMKEGISFHLILDVAKESGINDRSKKIFEDHKGLRGEIYLGQVVIKDGQATLNGKPLVADDEKQLLLLCRQDKK